MPATGRCGKGLSFTTALVIYCGALVLCLLLFSELIFAREGYSSHFVCLSVCLSVHSSNVLEDGYLLAFKMSIEVNEEKLSQFNWPVFQFSALRWSKKMRIYL